MMKKIYICIDLKSFYASVECVYRKLDPLNSNLVVADESRTNKTICLAATPAIKKFGVPSRARLFEVKQIINKLNYERFKKNKYQPLLEKSIYLDELNANNKLAIDFVIATPQMAKYLEISTYIYKIYLKYFAPEDILVYSIDEVFIDYSNYFKMYQVGPVEIVKRIMQDIKEAFNITATAGIGTNLYLAKIAMDIVAKHIEKKDKIAFLDEMLYKRLLWEHQPLTDFWRIGGGYAKRLNNMGLYTMKDIATYSLTKDGEDKLFSVFGVNAELLIDHAFGVELATMEDIKRYRPQNNSLGMGQVLHCNYGYDKSLIVLKEMANDLALELTKKNLVTKNLFLSIGYDASNLTDEIISKNFDGEIEVDRYGRNVPKGIHKSIRLSEYTELSKTISKAFVDTFNSVVDKKLYIRRLNISANVISKECMPKEYRQLDLFTSSEEQEKLDRQNEKEEAKQHTINALKKKYGKNAVIRGIDLEDGATTIERNSQIGGHKA